MVFHGFSMFFHDLSWFFMVFPCFFMISHGFSWFSHVFSHVFSSEWLDLTSITSSSFSAQVQIIKVLGTPSPQQLRGDLMDLGDQKLE